MSLVVALSWAERVAADQHDDRARADRIDIRRAYFDEALFRDALHTCKVKSRELNHIMPCEYYKGLADEDVSAIFAFLRSLPPVAHDVSNVDDSTPCPRCGQPHGLGERNEPMPAAR